MADDAMTARAAVRAAPVTDTLADESHFGVTLRRCGCGQTWLTLFTELIDWTAGDDSQAWMDVPITTEEADRLRGAKPRVHDRDLLDLHIERRHIARVHPRGGEATTTWQEGPLVILPHD